MQLCAVRSCGVRGIVRPRKYAGVATTSHAEVRSDAHRDHVLGNLFAEAHTGVVTLRDDIGEAIIDVDLDPDIGIVRQKFHELWPQDVSVE